MATENVSLTHLVIDGEHAAPGHNNKALGGRICHKLEVGGVVGVEEVVAACPDVQGVRLLQGVLLKCTHGLHILTQVVELVQVPDLLGVIDRAGFTLILHHELRIVGVHLDVTLQRGLVIDCEVHVAGTTACLTGHKSVVQVLSRYPVAPYVVSGRAVHCGTVFVAEARLQRGAE